MSPENEATPELVRWTFVVDPAHREAIEGYLDDHGADTLVRDGQTFSVSWDEPEHDLDEVLEAIWTLNGAPFEVTQEDFRRISLHVLHHAGGDELANLEAA